MSEPLINDDIVISGIGVVSSLGLNLNEFWNNCLKGISIVDKVPLKWTNYTTHKSGIWSPLPDINYMDFGISRIETLQHDKSALLAIIAAGQALKDAGISINKLNNRKNQNSLVEIDPNRVGIIIGSGIGGAASMLANHSCLILNNYKAAAQNYPHPPEFSNLVSPRKINPLVVSMTMANAVSAAVGIKYSIKGPNHTVTQACSSGTTAIGTAYKLIKQNIIDYAICGGAEYLSDEYGALYKSFDIAGTLAIPNENDIQGANRPFDENRSGFLYSEGGAGIAILERESSAEKRKAGNYAKIIGFSETFDACSMMNIEESATQIMRMMKNVLHDAGLNAGDIDYINTHGTGTMQNDEIEAYAIKKVFGDKPLINSSKSLLGHSIGASGALEAIITAMSLKYQKTHICKNLTAPVARLNFSNDAVRTHNIKYALTESFAFGGHNAGVIMQKI